MELLLFPVIIFFIAIAALSVLLHFVPIGLWISALAADVNISLFNLVGMRIRRVSPQMIVLPLIKHVLRTRKVRGFDICEISPRFDQDNTTANLGAVIIFAVVNTLCRLNGLSI